jgi:sugar lactone lactonase YvrE
MNLDSTATHKPVPLGVPSSELGEGPIWDGRTQSLIWVNITGRYVHRYWPADERVSSHRTPEAVGSVCLGESGRYTLALESGFWSATELLDDVRPLVIVHQAGSGLRFNDGKCDPAGRFWAGSMAYSSAPGAGSLYRLDPGPIATRVLTGIGISNGLDWSLDGRTCYYIDTLSQTVIAFDFDQSTGALSSRRELIRVDAADGSPDGLTVDSAGYLWVALWNGWAVRRYAPDGRLDREIRLPVAQVTSCAFGGSDLGDLFITCAAYDLSDDDRRSQPLAGSLFVFRPGVVGRPGVRRRDEDDQPS